LEKWRTRMTISKSIILTLVVSAGLVAGTLLVAGYADKPQTPAKADCPMRCEKCPLPPGAACCQADNPDGCTRPKACAGLETEKPCGLQPAGCCPSEAPAAPVTASEVAGCPMGGCPHTK